MSSSKARRFNEVEGLPGAEGRPRYFVALKRRSHRCHNGFICAVNGKRLLNDDDKADATIFGPFVCLNSELASDTSMNCRDQYNDDGDFCDDVYCST